LETPETDYWCLQSRFAFHFKENRGKQMAFTEKC